MARSSKAPVRPARFSRTAETNGSLVALPPEPVADLALQRLLQDQPCCQQHQIRALRRRCQAAVDQSLETLACLVGGGYSRCHGMLPGDPAPTGSPLPAFTQAGCIPTLFSSKLTPSPASHWTDAVLSAGRSVATGTFMPVPVPS